MNTRISKNKSKRSGYKWSINEILQLQRQYELLELSINQIANIHKRTKEAILYKIESENINR